MHGAPIPPEIAALERPREELLTWYILKALSTLIAFPVTMTLLYFRYHTMRYRFDEEGIHMSWGILMRHEIMLNYSRIQDIQLHSNVIERWLGLTRIEVQTAAGASDSEMTLEGIPNPEGMRDFLYSRMRGAHTASTAGTSAEHEPLAAVLLEIASELRSIREILETRRA
jgi:putative membrane protein